MRKVSNFFRYSKFSFSSTYSKEEIIFSQEYFLDNYKKSLEKTGLFQFNLDEKTKLIGVPFSSINDTIITDEVANYIVSKDSSKICLIQIDPSAYAEIKRDSYKSIQHLMKYKYEAILPNKPLLYNIEDIILEEAVFDFQNKKNDPNLTELLLTNFLKKEDKDLKQGTEMITYLHGSLLDYVVTENLLLHFNELINIMLLQTLENRKVYLSDIPINYYKILLAESLDLKLLDEMFNETMKAMKQYGLQKDIFNMFSMIYGHVIQIPRDIHLYGVLNNIKKTQPDQEITIYVEMQHFDSFQKYFQIKRKETNNESFLGVKGKYEIDMVEKIAILDIMLETKGTQETKVKMMDFLKTNIKEKRIQELYDITFEKYSEIRNTF